MRKNGRTKAKDIVRLRSKVRKKKGNLGDVCHVWVKSKSSNGRGRIRMGRRTSVQAQEANYELTFGRRLPDNVQMVNLCGNESCIKLSHWGLFERLTPEGVV